MKDLSVGEKIRLLRKKVNLTQLELEFSIEAASGSISKMEKGETNPSKETLIKIAEALKLNEKDFAWLFGIDLNKALGSVVNLSKELTAELDLKKIMQKAVDKLSKELNYVLVTTFLVKEDDKVYSQAYTQTKFNEYLNKLLPKQVDLINISLRKHTDNVIVRSINERKNLYTENFRDIGKHAVPKFVSELTSKLINFKCALVMPFIDSKGKSIGAIFFVKDSLGGFENEMPILNSFVEYLTTIIINAQKFQDLENEIRMLKGNKV